MFFTSKLVRLTCIECYCAEGYADRICMLPATFVATYWMMLQKLIHAMGAHNKYNIKQSILSIQLININNHIFSQFQDQNLSFHLY
jgi:hypothetical protein